MKEENITKDELDEDTINFFYQQYKTIGCTGHSEWSEQFQRNIWVSDYEEDQMCGIAGIYSHKPG